MRQLGRGTLLGVTLGAFAGAVLLLATSFTSKVDCFGKSPTECSFEEQLHRESTTWQRLGATGLGLLGAGGLVWIRTMKRA
jgi:hypothetical protein